MALELKEVRYPRFNTGLNVVDSTLDMQDSDLVQADNVDYIPSGEVQSIDGLTQIGSNLTVNSSAATKFLGACKFNGSIYAMVSNSTIARLMYYNGSAWAQANAQDFDPTALTDFIVYNSKLWFVNGLTTNSNVLHFLDTSNVLTGLTTASGLESGINHLVLHMERVWISKGNKVFVSVQYPTGATTDWDAGTAYSGSATAGLIQIDNNTEDAIAAMIQQSGNLVILRSERGHVVSGETILSSTIQRSYNSKGTISGRSAFKGTTNIFYLAINGVMSFAGSNVVQASTDFDSLEGSLIDRRIRSIIEADTSRTNWAGVCFKDKYYLTDTTSFTLVFDEVTGGWSKWTGIYFDCFLVDGDTLYGGLANKWYTINTNTSGSISSAIKTKDFYLGDDIFFKDFYLAKLTFRRLNSSFTVTIKWYLDGSTTAAGSLSVTVPDQDVSWDSGYYWDTDGLYWDTATINFFQQERRKLGLGRSIAFSVEATGTNRFSLQSISVLYEKLRKGA